MQTIFELKEQTVTETPLLLFDCVLADGRTEFWSTHRVTLGGQVYEARVLRHNVFEIQAGSDQGVDGIPRISLSLANADSHFSQLERSSGMKGARLTVRFLFYDLAGDAPATDTSVVFQGSCNPPEEITESTLRLSATNRMSMQRILLPQIRIQRRCPWDFPSRAELRSEAVIGGTLGKYSRYYRCGYSPDAEGGSGNLDGSGPFISCLRTREDCSARGMFRNFGGIEFVPSTIQVRGFGDKSAHASPVQANEGRYNDFVPLVYGTAWYNPPVVFARNDGNLTRMEVLLGAGEIESVLKVLVNDVEIPAGRSGTNMTGTGWYNVPTLGTRSGGFNLDFVNSDGTPAGDPYGSMAYLSLVVPSRLNNGQSLPSVKVLAQGLKLPVYGSDGNLIGEQFSANPAWVLLDVLRRSGWSPAEIDFPSFAETAGFCDEAIEAHDLHGNSVSIPRFQCNLAIQKRKSAGDLIRGIRNAARLYLTYAIDGRVQLRAEDTIARQQPNKPEGSNAKESLNGGWPAYEFGDGTYGFSGILRKETGEPSLRVWSRSTTETGNRFAVEFQDSLNEYQQDSFSLVDAEDAARVGQEITAPLMVFGLSNFDQAARILKFNLDKSLRGNVYVEFTTSMKGVGLKPGDLISLTYLREGLERQPFRVLKIAPGSNYSTARISAQIHNDDWYEDTNGQVTGSGGHREGGGGIGLPHPVGGSLVDGNGEAQFGIEEVETASGVGADSVTLRVSFAVPAIPASGGPSVPLLSLGPAMKAGGSLTGPQTLYYGVSGVDANGSEGPMSFVVRAFIPDGSGHSVELSGLSFTRGTDKFHVYRGKTPAQLFRLASNQEITGQFLDTGGATENTPAPDANFDHANFYWRLELQPESPVNLHSSTTVGHSSLEMAVNRYRGTVARITRGQGAGQERAIVANTDTHLTVAPAWDVEPDNSSKFVIAESGWKFGALARTSPVEFDIANRPGETVHICGRAANVNNAECAAELSVHTRWRIGSSGASDSDVPPSPSFSISPGTRSGTVEVRGVAFADLANTRTITAGTLTLFYWNEGQGTVAHALTAAITESDTVLTLNIVGIGVPGSYVQLDAEVLKIEERLSNGMEYRVSRGLHNTAAARHDAGTPLYHMGSRTEVMPFPPDFFGSPYCGSWSYPVALPDARLVSAELVMRNQRGDSDAGVLNFTQAVHSGLRLLSGGQYSIQVEGFLAIDQSVAPALVVDATRPVRDVFAILGKAADAPVELQVNVNELAYCSLTVPAGQLTSNGVDGFSLPLLQSGARVTVSVLAVGETQPGADLTVVIRL